MSEPVVVEPAAAPKTPEFTAEQQEHINKLFNQRFATVQSKHENEMKLMSEAIQDLKTKQPVVVAEPVKEGADAEENKRQMKALLDQEKSQTANMRTLLETEKAEKAKVLEENKAILKAQAIQDAAASLPNGVEFHELKTVKKLTEDDISFDKDSNQWVVKENGVVKLNASMLPMTLTEFYASYAATHPYLVKGVNKGGSGSAESGRSGSVQNGTTTIRAKEDFAKDTKAKVKFISDFGYEAYAALPSKR